jgi:hypothetical protein
MAQAIDRDTFTVRDYERFGTRLGDELATLRALLQEPGFGAGAPDIGAELELAIVDEGGRAAPLNDTIVAECGEPGLQLEIDRFNVEYNFEPVPAAGRPFSGIEAQMKRALAAVNACAGRHGARVVPVGILPTLTPADLAAEALSDAARYRALANGMRRLRHAPMSARISGPESVEFTCDDVTLEGANTSFQLHLRVPPARFAATYNAAQLATPLALAVAGNSPIFLERCLWDETRIALFKKSMDDRTPDELAWRRPARVGFGHGWVREGAAELFAESVAYFPPLIPVGADAEPDADSPPRLRALRVHQGTVWRWNRAVYDPAAGGHLRIEYRALPAGPTPADMAANAALLIGLTAGLAERAERFVETFPFQYAELNFYRAARDGLDAHLLWPASSAPSPREVPVGALLAELLSTAYLGLDTLGVDPAESARLLGVIGERLACGVTGARWQRRTLLAHEGRGGMPRRAALARMFAAYAAHSARGRPVHEWPAAG